MSLEVKYHIEDMQYMLSLYCPGECVNCSIWKEDKHTIREGEISLELFETMLQSESLKDCNYFDLTAGESQLSPKYVEVIKLITYYKPDAFIHTNISGWYPDTHFKVTQEALKYVKKGNLRLDISVDGTAGFYEKVRLVKDGFEKVMKSIEKLRTLDVTLRFVIVLFRETYEDLDNMLALAKQLNMGYYIAYPRYSPQNFKNSEKTHYFSTQELQKIEAKLESIGWLSQRRRPNWLWAKSIYEDNIPEFDCFMGSRALVMSPYGDVYPCNEMFDTLKMGNIKDFKGDMDALLKSEKAQNVVNHVLAKKCQPCGMLCAHKIHFPWGDQTGLQGSSNDK